MAETLANIQAEARFYANDGRLAITSGDNLRIVNIIHQGMATPDFVMPGTTFRIGRRWPEYTREDTSLTTTAGTEQYNWPTSPVFIPPTLIEILDASSSNLPWIIPWTNNMVEWSDLDDSNNGIPERCRLIDVAGVTKLALRPKPDTTGDTIRITGLIEAKPWPAPSTTTVDVDSASGQTVLSVAATTMFQAGDHVLINEGGAREERRIVSSVTAGASITLTANLTYTHTAAQADVVALTTPFLNRNTDRALSILIASTIVRQRGNSARAMELAVEALALLPLYDITPVIRPAPLIKPMSL